MKWLKKTISLTLGLVLFSSSFSNIDFANAANSEPILSGSYSSFTGNVNLENEGTLDWAYWGHEAFNQKVSGPKSISDTVIFGGGDQKYLKDSQISYSWDKNGSVWPSSYNNTSGKYTNRGETWQGGENGMYFTVPASENIKILDVYGSYWGTKAEISATLGDGLLEYVEQIDTQTNVNKYYKTQILFSSEQEQDLKFQIKITDPYDQRWGSVSIHAATIKEITGTTIMLKGDEEIDLELGSDFVDPGANAFASYGEITNSIAVIGAVNTSECGVYVLEYTVTDDNGNMASAFRTITVRPSKAKAEAIRTENGSKTVKITGLPNSNVNLYDNTGELIEKGISNNQGIFTSTQDLISVSYTATQVLNAVESLMSEVAYFPPDLSQLPKPIVDNHPEWIELYDKAWDLHKNSISKTNLKTGFVNYYVDEMLDSNTIFQWDTIFMTFFNNYSNNEFPGMDSLENFYRKQKDSGYICRVLKESDGSDDYGYTESSADSVNPPLFAYAEWNFFKITGDTDRFTKMINGEPLIERIAMFYRWIKANRRNTDGTYWTNGQANGHDNIPLSWNKGTGWVDLVSQQASSAYYISKIADVIGYTELKEEFDKEFKELSEFINETHWDEEEKFYHNTFVNGGFDKAGNNRTILGWWPMAVNIASDDQAKSLVKGYIMNPNEFWRPAGISTLSYQSKDYDATGAYWRGSIWAPTSYMTNMALNNYGYHEEAFQHAVHYINAMYTTYKEVNAPFITYKNDGKVVKDLDNRYKQTLWECYSPEYLHPASYSYAHRLIGPDFVGWTGAGPIAMLIEDVIGLKVNAYEDTLDWHLSLTERNGIEDFKFGDNFIKIYANERTTADEKAVITVETNSPFTLNVIIDGVRYTQAIPEGNSTFEIGENAAGKPAVLDVESNSPDAIHVNLSEEGSLDWVQYGQDDGNTINRKDTDTKYFSETRYIGRDNVVTANDSQYLFSWNDGEVNKTGTNVKTKMANNLSGQGFEFDVLADQTLRTLKVYVSNYGIDSKFDVEISDGSFAHNVTMTDSGGKTNVYKVFTIDYRATKPDQFLTVRFTGGRNLYDEEWGSVCLLAATLSSQEDAPLAEISFLSDGSEISNLSEASNKELEVSVKLNEALIIEIENPEICIALYDKVGRITNLLSPSKAENGSYFIGVPENTDGMSLKIFLWDKIFAPLTEPFLLK